MLFQWLFQVVQDCTNPGKIHRSDHINSIVSVVLGGGACTVSAAAEWTFIAYIWLQSQYLNARRLKSTFFLFLKLQAQIPLCQSDAHMAAARPRPRFNINYFTFSTLHSHSHMTGKEKKKDRFNRRKWAKGQDNPAFDFKLLWYKFIKVQESPSSTLNETIKSL